MIRISLAVLMLCCAVGASAQSTLGVVLGTVRDATGAVVADASIKLTNVGENTSSETKSGSDGEYAFRNVKAGSYTVVVTHPGFRTFTARDLTLIARETLRVDAQLSVGDVTQAVEVSAVAGAIATDTPVVASTLTTESVLSLPSNVRAGGSTSPYALI